VRTALRQVEAPQGEAAARRPQLRHVEGELGEPRLAAAGDRVGRIQLVQQPEPHEPLGDADADPAGEVVVARPRVAERDALVGAAQRPNRDRPGDPAERLERGSHVRPCEAVETAAPVRVRVHETAREEPPQVVARPGGREPGAERQLAGRQRLAAEELREDGRTRRVREQRPHRREVDVAAHAPSVPPRRFSSR
jgi:hypothetical protein